MPRMISPRNRWNVSYPPVAGDRLVRAVNPFRQEVELDVDQQPPVGAPRGLDRVDGGIGVHCSRKCPRMGCIDCHQPASASRLTTPGTLPSNGVSSFRRSSIT
jgi:hypothetical protein